jgi:hypothetical protein
MTADSHPTDRGHDLLNVERLVGLSDNVVAFALTLLVLQVTVPPRSQVADPASAADLAAQHAKQAGPPPGLPPRGRPPGQPGVVELRVPDPPIPGAADCYRPGSGLGGGS